MLIELREDKGTFLMSKIKYSFRNDYSELAHPKVLKKLSSVGEKQFEGYGLDIFSKKASDLIRDKIGMDKADVHFVSGGTQANLVVLSSILRPHEAVISCGTGHIFTNETGAIEATGHKICISPGESGKLYPKDIETVIDAHDNEHRVKPKVVFISHSTEIGTVYTRDELLAIHKCCKNNNLFLYLDGARLGQGINSDACDLTYQDIAKFTDVLYLGGTKNGGLFGEAIVITNESLQSDFRYFLKQRGALLAKGAAIGIQFLALLENNLYDELAIRANQTARKLADGIMEMNIGFYSDPESNQVFPILPLDVSEKMHSLYGFYDWKMIDNESVANRLVVSWATPEHIITDFLEDLRSFIK